MGNDDHDLNFRAYASHRWVAGFRPLDFDAPLASGGTRRKTPVTQTKEEMIEREGRERKLSQKLSALEKFKRNEWRNTDVHAVLDFSIGNVNLRAMMQIANNSLELTTTHDQSRPLCGTISK